MRRFFTGKQQRLHVIPFLPQFPVYGRRLWIRVVADAKQNPKNNTSSGPLRTDFWMVGARVVSASLLSLRPRQ